MPRCGQCYACMAGAERRAFVDRTDAEALRVGPFENENDHNLATIKHTHNVKRL